MADRSIKPTRPTVTNRGPLAKRGPRAALVITPPVDATIGAAFVNATLPEKMVYGWLTRNAASLDIQWAAQDPQLGQQFQEPGSAKVDVTILAPIKIYWRIQGAYYHLSNAGVIARDYLQRLALTKTAPVVDLWENDIYADVDSVCRDALALRERPRPDGLSTPSRPLGI